MPAGAARNALDCALWDYTAKRCGARAAALAGIGQAQPCLTAYTVSLGDPAAMAARAAEAAETFPLLKIKLGGAGDAERMRRIREACPASRLIADANEAWTEAMLPELLAVAADTRFEVVEQPLPAGEDQVLARVPHLLPICADESFHTGEDLARLGARYEAVNIKLDKTGGLTAALALAKEARERGLKIMVGCMVATSLAMAPALLLAQGADWVDLDGPLLLARDRTPSLRYEGALVYPPEAELWG
jgi:L-alanine-DL-glutamate epimerase-like enolase superfamily enzyme